jgi:polysaccharide biosynthesis/export protein
MKKSSLVLTVVLAFVLSFAQQGFSQQGTGANTISMPPQLQQAVDKGLVTPQQAQAWMAAIAKGQITSQQVEDLVKAYQSGQISPDIMKQYQQKLAFGTLTPQDIDAGMKLLDQLKQTQAGSTQAPVQQLPPAQPPGTQVAPAQPPGTQVMPAQPPGTQVTPAQPPVPPPGAPPLATKVEEKPAVVIPKALPSEEEYFKKTPPPTPPVLEIFGQNLFTAVPSTFAPIVSLPVSNDYVIGPGDELKILMWGRLDSTLSLQVDNEGVINFPKVGPLIVAGLTFGEVKELIRVKAEAMTGVNINVSMGKLRTIQVFVLGEVKSPGVYTVSSLSTVVNALLASGGPTPLGSLRKVELKRQGKTVTFLDLYDLLLKGDTSGDVRLMPGDTIFIPQCGSMVSVSGNVKRPAIYEMKDDRSLQNAILLAGGLKPQAYNQRIQVERAFENRVQIVLDISSDELQQKKPVPLFDGDLIRVFPIHFRLENAVYLYGNVIRPGEYAYRPGLRILDILPDVKSVDLDTYFGYALIKRYHHEESKAELLPFDLGKLLISKDKSQNLALKPRDEIYVFNKETFQELENATVQGEVRRPGIFPIEGMKVKDIIFKAGNLTKDAYMDLGHLYRTDPKSKDVTIIPFSVAKVMEGDPQENLSLKDRDLVVILSQWDYVDKYTVSVRGKVNRPGDYPYAKNMTVRDLILVGGNIMESAYLGNGELVRYDIVQGKKVETSLISFDVSLALKNDPVQNLRLKPFDVVNIKEIPEWKEKRTVTITGEVLFPGTYQIRREERLSGLIQRAGGFTDNAYLRGALFTRESIKKAQQERLNDLVKQMEIEGAQYASAEAQAALSKEDVAAQQEFLTAQRMLLAKLREAKATGRVVITLLPSNVLRDASMDMILEDGDSLNVPKNPGTVNVLGAVYNPNALIFEAQKPEVIYYLKKTGGPTENAEADKMYVVRVDGTVVAKAETGWFNSGWSDEEKRWEFGSSFEDTRLYPGDTVLVPQKIIKPSYMKEVKDITTILYQIAVGAGVVIAAF